MQLVKMFLELKNGLTLIVKLKLLLSRDHPMFLMVHL